MHSLNKDTVLVRSSGCIDAELDNELVIMSIAQNKFHTLDATGMRIWDLLAQPTTIAAMTRHLMQIYDVTREVCEDHLLALLAQMRQQKLVVLREDFA